MTLIPKIAFIGLPNAGKSSLLNRLTGSKVALVDKVANTTRDLNFGEEVWENYLMQFVDTGGLVPDTQDKIIKQVQIKSWEAIASSDLLLWLMDKKKDPQTIPFKVLQRIRKTGKPFIVVVTKVDDPNQEKDYSDYAFLGGDDFVNISTNTGYGLNVLADKIVEQLQKLGFKENLQIELQPRKIKTKRSKLRDVQKSTQGDYYVVRGNDNLFETVDSSELNNQPSEDLEGFESEEIKTAEKIPGIVIDLSSVLLSSLKKEKSELTSFILTQKTLGRNIYFLTDLKQEKLDELLPTSILRFFDGGISSQENSSSKVNVETFDYLSKKYDLDNENSVYVDQNLDTLSIADQRGFKVIHFQDFTKFAQELNDFKAIKIPRILFLGKPNVGKSSLFNAMSGKDFQIVSEIAGTTIGVNDLLVARKVTKKLEFLNTFTQEPETIQFESLRHYILVDSTGIRRPSQRQTYIENIATYKTIQTTNSSDVICLVFDGSEMLAHQDQLVAGIAKESRKSMVILVNKSDLLTPEAKASILKDFKFKFAFLKLEQMIFVSSVWAIEKKPLPNYVEPLSKIWENVDLAFNQTYTEIDRATLRKIFNYLVKKQPPKKLRNKKKAMIYDLLLTSHNPLKFELLVKDAKTIHWSYIRFLENLLRRNFDFSNTQLKIELKEVEKKKVLSY